MRTLLSIFVLTLLVAGTALAQDRIQTPPPAVDQPAVQKQAVEFDENSGVTTIEILPEDADKAAGASLRPAMMEELRIVREEESRRVAELVAELETAVTSDQRLEIQNRISDVKADAIHQFMTIQLEYAQLGGHQDLAQRLETDIEQFETRRAAPRGVINTDTVRQRPLPGGESR